MQISAQFFHIQSSVLQLPGHNYGVTKFWEDDYEPVE
ncbi:hypothetical protein SAMN05216604_110154 [Pseudomonas agarici]|nr:hypothetical protein SAMN05216604_110154 [Pseudomonas agarici]